METTDTFVEITKRLPEINHLPVLQLFIKENTFRMTNFVIIAVMRRSGALRIMRWPFELRLHLGNRRKPSENVRGANLYATGGCKSLLFGDNNRRNTVKTPHDWLAKISSSELTQNTLLIG